MPLLPQPPSGGFPLTASHPHLDLVGELDEIRAVQVGLRRRFVVLNGGGFVLVALLATMDGPFFTTRLLGRLTLGTLLCLLQVTLLTLTAWLYDRDSRLRTDPRVDRVRAHAARPPQPQPSVPHGRTAAARTQPERRW